jgi:hypothetical protein
MYLVMQNQESSKRMSFLKRMRQRVCENEEEVVLPKTTTGGTLRTDICF